MRTPFARPLLALILTALPCAPAPAQANNPNADPAPRQAQTTDLIAALAPRIGGEWKMTSQSGKSLYDTWHWGPGRHSLRVMTDGESASGDPWHALQVFYHHPGLKQSRVLTVNPYARSVGEGSVTFDGKTVESPYDLYQTGNRRKIVSRDVFNGSDTYHIALLEQIDDRLMPLVEWDYIRSEALRPAPPLRLDQPPALSDRLKALQPLLGYTWETETKSDGLSAIAGDHAAIQSTFKWIRDTEAIYGRTIALARDKNDTAAEPAHLLDTYIYHHTGANVLRCLALTSRGGVYEGDITVLGDGSLQAELTGYEDDRAARYTVRLDFEKDGILRCRAWSLEGADRSLLFDIHHKQAASK